jgi:hypothetical protein
MSGRELVDCVEAWLAKLRVEVRMRRGAEREESGEEDVGRRARWGFILSWTLGWEGEGE